MKMPECPRKGQSGIGTFAVSQLCESGIGIRVSPVLLVTD
jgi:hypothetical protein